MRLALLLVAAWATGGSATTVSGGGLAALSVLTGDLAGRCAATVLAWVLLGAMAHRLARLPGVLGALSRAAVRVLVPRALRATVLGLAGSQAVLGLAVAGAPQPVPAAGPAAADSLEVQRPVTGDGALTLAPAPVAAPVAAAAPAALQAGTAPAAAPPPREVVVVAPGDTLWTIAARHLPPGASDAQVAAAWPAWFEANAVVIGPDPDVLATGAVLAVPASASLSADTR
jgi:hypothetical protein